MKAKRRRRIRLRERRARKVRRLAQLAAVRQAFGSWEANTKRDVLSPVQFARMFMGIAEDPPSENRQIGERVHKVIEEEIQQTYLIDQRAAELATMNAVYEKVRLASLDTDAQVVVSGRRRYMSFQDIEQRMVEAHTAALLNYSQDLPENRPFLQLLDEWKEDKE